MSDRPIQVGDLVRVAKWPCCDKYLGEIGIVDSLHTAKGSARCTSCNAILPALPYAGVEGRAYYPLPWLKRIPPLEELQLDRLQEETPA